MTRTARFLRAVADDAFLQFSRSPNRYDRAMHLLLILVAILWGLPIAMGVGVLLLRAVSPRFRDEILPRLFTGQQAPAKTRR
jgi:hypothetical protein